MTPRFATALSAHPDTRIAVGEAVGAVLEHATEPPDLAVVMFTDHHVDHADDVALTVNSVLAPVALVGASAAGVLGGGQGREHEPGLTLWAAWWSTSVQAVGLDTARSGTALSVVGLSDDELEGAAALLLWVDPWTFPTDALLDHLTRRHPQLQVIGGFASGGQAAGHHRLVLGPTARASGAVGVILPPGLLRATVVSQGCTPIGQPWTVTASHRNVIEQLGGRPAFERLRELIEALSPDDRARAMGGLHCGLLADDRALDPDRGDFLVRGVIGADPGSGSLAVSADVPVGTVVQFHMRDAVTAGEDLERRLREAIAPAPDGDRGALVFTCNGRGRAMFGTPHHDAEIVARVLGHQTAGMMCAGEIGPVAGRTHLHGFTASTAVF